MIHVLGMNHEVMYIEIFHSYFSTDVHINMKREECMDAFLFFNRHAYKYEKRGVHGCILIFQQTCI